MSLTKQFEKASQDIKTLTAKPSSENLLKLYSFYKQATSGDVSGKRPGMLNMVGRSKYDAWAKIKGMSTDDAQKSYIDLVESLL
jgi:acyl-CoA-binding protein